MAPRPSLIEWTDHALLRAEQFDVTRADAEGALIEGHEGRAANPGAGQWLARKGNLSVIYDWPTDEGTLRARLVTLWIAR